MTIWNLTKPTLYSCVKLVWRVLAYLIMQMPSDETFPTYFTVSKRKGLNEACNNLRNFPFLASACQWKRHLCDAFRPFACGIKAHESVHLQIQVKMNGKKLILMKRKACITYNLSSIILRLIRAKIVIEKKSNLRNSMIDRKLKRQWMSSKQSKAELLQSSNLLYFKMAVYTIKWH